MTENVIMLANELSNGLLWRPRDMFMDAAQRVTNESPESTKGMGIFMDGDNILYNQCGMKLTEMILMLSRLKEELMFELIKANMG